MQLKGFLNLNFGESKDVAILKINSRGGFLNTEFSDDNILIFHNLNFGGRDTSAIMLSFFNGLFCKATVRIPCNKYLSGIEMYKQIKNEINSKYFLSNDDYVNGVEEEEYTNTEIDNFVIDKIANICCFWEFNNDTYSERDFISISLDPDLHTTITYENGHMNNLLVNQKKQNDLLDY